MSLAPQYRFVFDVESIGLHGEGFAVAGGIYAADGLAVREFAYHCDPSAAIGSAEDRQWVRENVTISERSALCPSPVAVRDAFWRVWSDAKAGYDVTMFVECGWPVEARFLAACIEDAPDERNWDGPYPLHEIASVMLAAGMNPMGTYTRLPNELPPHEPLADSRLSARLLFEAFGKLGL